MTTEIGEHPEGGEPPPTITRLDEFVAALGPMMIEAKTGQEDPPLEEGTLRFWLTEIDQKKRPDKDGIQEFLLTIIPNSDPETKRELLRLSLQARFGTDDELESVVDLSEVDAFDPQMIERIAGGFSLDSLQKGGFDELVHYLRTTVLHESEQVSDELSGPEPEISVEDKDRMIGLHQKERYFSDEAETATIGEIVERFRGEFPEYTKTDAVKEDNVFMFGEAGEDGLAPYIRIYQASNGFSVEYGKATLKQNRNRGTIIDKKPVKDWNAPLFRSETPDTERSWDFWEVGEAAEVLKLRQQDLVVDAAFLNQPASWLESEGRVVTFREMIGYWAGQGLMSDTSLAGLAVEGATKIPLPRALTEEQLRAVVGARLVQNSEESSMLVPEITDQQVRQEFRKIEVAATRLVRGKGYFTIVE